MLNMCDCQLLLLLVVWTCILTTIAFVAKPFLDLFCFKTCLLCHVVDDGVVWVWVVDVVMVPGFHDVYGFLRKDGSRS